jgi:hypothetical protein
MADAAAYDEPLEGDEFEEDYEDDEFEGDEFDDYEDEEGEEGDSVGEAEEAGSAPSAQDRDEEEVESEDDVDINQGVEVILSASLPRLWGQSRRGGGRCRRPHPCVARGAGLERFAPHSDAAQSNSDV